MAFVLIKQTLEGKEYIIRLQGLLALEGELTPVLVSLVNSDKHVTGMLDTPVDVSGTMQR